MHRPLFALSFAPLLGFGFALVSTVAIVHCDAAGDDPTTSDNYDGSPFSGVADASNRDPDGDASERAPRFRIAHVAPEIGAIDICYRIAPTEAFTGPLLGAISKDAGTGDADADATGAAEEAGADASTVLPIAFTSVSPYLALPIATTVEIAVVTATDRSCSAPRARIRLAMEAGKHTTFAFLGVPNADAGTSELGLVPFVDDPSPDPTSARTRFIHAALGTTYTNDDPVTLSVTAARASTTIPLAKELLPRRASTPSGTAPVVDPLGYHASAPLDGVALELTAVSDASSGASWTSSSTDLALRAGSIHTGFVVRSASRAVDDGYRIVWCDDLAGTCTLLD